MEFHLLFTSGAGEGDLATLPGVVDGAAINTNFARVALRLKPGSEGLRLDVTLAAANAALPRPQAQRNPVAASVARQLEQTEAWVAILAESDIFLQGSLREPRCSVSIPDAALQARGVTDFEGLRATAEYIVLGVLIALLFPVAVSPTPRN